MQSAGGYRLVRLIGEGDRAEVWLGHAGADGIAAVKILRDDLGPAGLDAEIMALERARSRHVVDLLDVGTDARGRPCLILARLPGPSVAGLLGARARLEPGELVTIAAPVVATVAELQRRGVAHGALSARSVLLDEEGAPVIVGFGGARVVSAAADRPLSPAAIEEDPALRADRDAVLGFVAGVAASTGETGAPLLGWLSENREAEGVLDALVDRLHGFAVARPVSSRDPAVVVPSVRYVPVSTSPPPQQSTRGIGRILADLVEEGAGGALMPRLRAALGRVRRRVWIVGAAGAVAMILAFAVIPAASPSDAAPVPTPKNAAPRAPVGTSTARARPAPPQPIPEESADGTPAEGSTPHETAPTPAEDDPVEAARHVLVERMHCLRLHSVACLDDVDQPGSAALTEDRAHIADTRSIPPVPRELALVERLGDTAIIGVGELTSKGGYPTSVLIVKTSVGWRLRDTITGTIP